MLLLLCLAEDLGRVEVVERDHSGETLALTLGATIAAVVAVVYVALAFAFSGGY